jgi:protein-tyrosine phosphatase
MSSEAWRPNWIALEGAANARAVLPGVLLRSDNLQALSARDVRLLVERQALEVVLDLRTDVEVELEGPAPITRERGVRIEYHSLYPDSRGDARVDGTTVKPWVPPGKDDWPDEPPVVRAYMSYLHRRPDSIVGSIRAIARAGGAALVHCAAGKDRTGVVVALALDAAGVQHEVIVADYTASRERVQEIVTRLIGSPIYRDGLEGNDPRRLAPVPETMERFLKLVDERFGGSASWLSAHGLDEHDLARLRRRLAPIADASGADYRHGVHKTDTSY